MVHSLHEDRVFALLQVHRQLCRTFLGFSPGGLFQHESVVDPYFEQIVGAQCQVHLAVRVQFECAIEIKHAVHAVQFVHELVRFGIFEVAAGGPSDFLTHARIRRVEVDCLFRLIFGCQTHPQAFRFKGADHLPWLRFGRSQPLRQFFILRRGQTPTANGPLRF